MEHRTLHHVLNHGHVATFDGGNPKIWIVAPGYVLYIAKTGITVVKLSLKLIIFRFGDRYRTRITERTVQLPPAIDLDMVIELGFDEIWGRIFVFTSDSMVYMIDLV
jgi:hypothetical protein